MRNNATIKRLSFLGLSSILAVLLCQCTSTVGTHAGAAHAGRAPAGEYSQDATRPGAQSTGLATACMPLPKKTSPGLGTSWGEGRRSHVRNTAFERSRSKPDSTLAIRYNDTDGAPDRRWSTRQPFYAGNTASVAIKSRGRYLKAFDTGRDPIVIGKSGQRYSIHVKNRTDDRIEVVLSVDGLDVQDGKSASYRKRGYVIAPHGTLEVEGFRRSYESVAAFRFGDIDDSYAARSTGSTRNVGIIGAAVFKEKGAGRHWSNRPDPNPFPGESGSGLFAKPPRQ